MHTKGPPNERARKIKAALAWRGWSVNMLVARLPARLWRGRKRRPSRNAVSRAIHQGTCPKVLEEIERLLGL